MNNSDDVSLIKSRVDLVKLIEQSVPLKQRGYNYVGLCPFHDEKSPSFTVYPQRGFYYCFGCQASGDVFSYLMQQKGLTFPEALQELANLTGIVLSKTKDKTGYLKFTQRREILYEVNQKALNFFREQFVTNSENLLKYLADRGFTNEIIEMFSIGFAPQGGLVHYLNIKPQIGVAAGLFRKRVTGEPFATFRDRLIFPIFIDNGKIAGFGGRVLTNTPDIPKYLNSPETEIFKKSAILYGLHEAIIHIRSCKLLYIVEGYFDVLGLWEVGIKNVVATCGTAISKEHVTRISSLTKKVRLLFDGDDAGKKAAANCFKLFCDIDCEVQVIHLPKNEDPDSFRILHGLNTTNKLSELPHFSLLEHMLRWEAYSRGEDFNALSPATRAKLGINTMNTLDNSISKLVKATIRRELAFLLKLDEQLLFKEEQHKELPKNNIVPINTKDNSLSKLDREIIICCAILKNEFPWELLQNSFLPNCVASSILLFLTSLRKFYNETENHETPLEVKPLLEPQWHELWDATTKNLLEYTTNLDRIKDQAFISLNQCLLEAKKIQLGTVIKNLEEQLKIASTDQEKGDYARELLKLQRQLREAV
jgi:DNA primase